VAFLERAKRWWAGASACLIRFRLFRTALRDDSERSKALVSVGQAEQIGASAAAIPAAR
jgi:hypothetical protein